LYPGCLAQAISIVYLMKTNAPQSKLFKTTRVKSFATPIHLPVLLGSFLLINRAHIFKLSFFLNPGEIYCLNQLHLLLYQSVAIFIVNIMLHFELANFKAMLPLDPLRFNVPYLYFT